MATTPNQHEMLIYGRPDQGALIAGATQAQVLALLAWSDERGLGSVSVGARLALKRAESAQQAWLDALSVQDGNLTLATQTSPEQVTWCNVTSEGDGVYITSTSGSVGVFTTQHVGSAVRVAGEWFPVVGWRQESGGRASLIVRLHPLFAGSLPGDDTGVTVAVARPVLRLVDSMLEDLEGSEAVPLVAGGMRLRVTLGRPDDADDDVGRRVVMFRAVAEALAEERKKDDAARAFVRASSIRRSVDVNGHQVAEFSATVTAGNVSGASTLFPAILDEFWVTWTGAVLEALAESAGGFRWEAVTPRVESFPVEQRVGTVTQQFRRTNLEDLRGVADDPRIHGATVIMGAVRRHVHGLRGVLPPLQVTIRWSAAVQLTGSDAVSEGELQALWERSVKPFLVARAVAVFGGVAIMFASQLDPLDMVGYKASGSVQLLMLRSTSTVIGYSRTTSIERDERVEDDDLHDGEADTFASYTPGSATVGSVTVAFTQLDQPAPQAPGGGAPVALPGGGVFFGSGGALSLTMPAGGVFGAQGGGTADQEEELVVLPTPGDPSRFFPDQPNDGEWVVRSRRAQESPQHYGEDVVLTGLGRVRVVQTVYVGAYRYRRRGTRDVTTPPIIRPASGGGGGAATSTTTREREPRA